MGCFRYLRIRTIFKMANIVTWQERGLNLLATKYASKDILNVLTKVHFVQFATIQRKSPLERNSWFSAVSTSNIFQKNILLIGIVKATN